MSLLGFPPGSMAMPAQHMQGEGVAGQGEGVAGKQPFFLFKLLIVAHSWVYMPVFIVLFVCFFS